ncbi:MAG: ROK family protein [Flavitalea sp.]
MSLLGIDLGGTKLAIAVISSSGDIIHKESIKLEGREGKQVGALVTYVIGVVLKAERFSKDPVHSIGICVPGIIRMNMGTVWAPNIPGWENYALMDEVKSIAGNVPVIIDSDRTCYLQGEIWKGNAKGCKDAIYLSVGTGIGAGIITDGKILRGSQNISGAIGWMALNKPFVKEFTECGNFEYFSSGKGIARLAQDILKAAISYEGQLRNKNIEDINSHDVFVAYENDDEIALNVMSVCVEYWGMAVANLISLFNPAKIILGGGIFGPAVSLIPEIKEEASKWAQPISMQQVSIEASELGSDAGVYGAAYLALHAIHPGI